MGSIAMLSDPVVSCLMVTLGGPERMAFVRRSVADYCAQTYRRRELVIVCEPAARDATALLAYVASLGRRDIRVCPTDALTTLGALRNFSRASARGDVHCQWDDDDRHHPERIERQLAALGDGDGVLLDQVMLYEPAAAELRCLNWRGVDLQAFPGTLMCRADAPLRYPEAGEAARRGEDSEAVRQLELTSELRVLSAAPHLYVYVRHGANTWDAAHFGTLRDRLAVSRGLLLRREAALRAGLAAYDFGPETVTVMGSNGAAFELASRAR